MIKQCSRCEKTDIKLFNTFGKLICKDCLEKRRTGIKGHSGMIYDSSIDENDYKLDGGLFKEDGQNEKLYLKQVPKSNKLFVKWYIEHYPKSKGIVGRQINYLIYSFGKPIGILGFASPPLNYKKFNKYFNFTKKDHGNNAKLFLNNNVFRIVHTEKNIGTKLLKMARKELPIIYKKKYNSKLLGLVTFVERPRTGAMYKADNWDYIGETQGVEVKRRGENWQEKQYNKGEKKLIFGYKLTKHK